MNILLFKNAGFISNLIKWQTRSPYCHAAIECRGVVYEAWWNGVRALPWADYQKAHYGDPYDLYALHEPLTQHQNELLAEALAHEVGKPYAYHLILAFLTRADETGETTEGNEGVTAKDWFCSELVFAKLEPFARLLERIEPWQVRPGDIAYSPLLALAGSYIAGSVDALQSL